MPHCRSRDTYNMRSRSQRQVAMLTFATHAWAETVGNVEDCLPQRLYQDGSCASQYVQWDSVKFQDRHLETVEKLARVATKFTNEFLSDHDEFISEFMSATRDEQSQMSSRWNEVVNGKSISDVVMAMTEEFADILEPTSQFDKATLMGTAAYPSPLRTLLLHECARISAISDLEDIDVCKSVHDGVAVGLQHDESLSSPFWPSYGGADTPLREGEPPFVRWPGSKFGILEDDKFDMNEEGLEGRQLSPDGHMEEDMIPAYKELLSAELQSGRVAEISECEVAALTKVSVMWKKPKPGASKSVRPLDDYRRSGLNQATRFHLGCTICLPRIGDFLSAVAEATPCRSCKGYGTKVLEWDVRSAFRLVPVRLLDQPYLSFLNPLYKWGFCNMPAILCHRVMPFGLVVSPIWFCRLSGCCLRVAKRLLAASLSLNEEDHVLSEVRFNFRSFCYVDDMTTIMCNQHARFGLVYNILLYCCFGVELEFAKVHCLDACARVLGYDVNLRGNQPIISIPADKCEAIIQTLDEGVKTVKVKSLRTLAGRLVWASQLVPNIKPELIHIYELLAVADKHQLRSVCISTQRMQEFAKLAVKFRGACPTIIHRIQQQTSLRERVMYPKEIYLVTDASLSGLGGYYYVKGYPWRAKWFNIHCENGVGLWNMIVERLEKETFKLRSGNMCALELLAAVLGLMLIGEDMSCQSAYITCVLDNLPAAKILQKFTSKSQTLQSIVTIVSDRKYKISSVHISGVCNRVSDEISRNPKSVLSSMVPSSWRGTDDVQLHSILNTVLEGA